MDDAYIHLAIGRTLAADGVWGVQPTDPAAASSSPLWTLLLAGAHLIWPTNPGYLVAPLLLNVAIGIALVWLWTRLLAGVRWRWLCLLILVAIVPLNAMSLIAMEHVLHILLATALAWAGARAVADDAPASPLSGPLALATLGALAVGTRYESLFLVLPLAGLALLRGRVSLALALGFGAALPVLGFGAFWSSHGGWLLPNPLLVKGLNDGPDWGGRLWRFTKNLRFNSYSLSGITLIAVSTGLLALCAADFMRERKLWRWHLILVSLALTATASQVVLAATGWLYRYEAWVLGLDYVVVFLLMGRLAERRAWAPVLALFFLFALPRGVSATRETVMAVDDRRLEHLLPAEFIRANYAGRVVVLNDLGAVAYYSGVRSLDMVGLGSNEPIRLRAEPGGYTAAALRRWAETEGAAIGVFQICWEVVHQRLPEDWPIVAVWRVPRNVVFEDRLVAFVAVAPGEAERLRRMLQGFRLPPSVEARYTIDAALEAYLRAWTWETEFYSKKKAAGCY